MNESMQTEIRFKTKAAYVTPAEVALLESILPEILHAMMQAKEIPEAD